VWGREDELQRLEFAVVFEVPGSDLPASMRIPTGKPRRVAGAVVQHRPAEATSPGAAGLRRRGPGRARAQPGSSPTRSVNADTVWVGGVKNAG